MPPIDGLTLTKYVRATQVGRLCDTPIVIMTTECHRDVLLRAKQVGIDQLCLKPLSPEKLLRRIEAALVSRRAIAETVNPEMQFKASFFV